MLAAQHWVVCEQSGRWSAWLRVAFGRLPGAGSSLRLLEVRTLRELLAHSDDRPCDLSLIEVGPENLTEILQLLVRRDPRLDRFVALLEGIGDQPHMPIARAGEPIGGSIADLLIEAGAIDIVESPRQLRGLMALHNRLWTIRRSSTSGVAEAQSFVDWAWSTIPWQDP
jgi:hypothetical protein